MEHVEPDQRRDGDQRDEREREREAHRAVLRRKAASGRSQSPEVERTTWRAPVEVSACVTACRSPVAAAANRARSLASRVSTRSCLPGLGVDEVELAEVGELLLARVTDLDGDDVVAAGEVEQRAAPVDRPAEVGDDGDERALARDRGRVAQCLSERRELPLDREPSWLLAERRQQPDQTDPALARRQRLRVGRRRR